MKPIVTSLLAFLCFFLPAVAGAAGEAPEQTVRMDRYAIRYVINADGSYTETREKAMTVLKEQAVAQVKTTYVSYSTSIQKADILEAYTRKPDGRRIDVPKSNFQVESNTGKDKDMPAFSDWTTMTIIFPEVQAGDTLVLNYRLTALEPMFPNHFSTVETFPRNRQYDDVRIAIDAPAALEARYDARQMKEVLNTEKDGRRLLEWHFENRQPVRSKREDYSVYDLEKEPGLTYSTFRSHAEIARIYGARAKAKAVVTDRIRKLADDIVKDGKPPRETAKALYDWVATNISYAGNCIGLGAVVPRDMDFVLDNRMGDCKDHATLLEALLAAKGIASTQALVNSGSSYRLLKIPVVSMVNHVINYIPSLDLYVDSTSDSTPFGMLPFSDMDKPVLLVDGYRDGLKTPALPVGTNHQTMKTVINIQPDGSIKGEVEVALKGIYAADARARMRDMTKETQAELVKTMFKRMGYIGSGVLEKEDPKELLDTYKYRATMEVKDFFQIPGAGAFPIKPYFYNQAPIYSFIADSLQPDEEPVEFACSNGRSVEEYTFVFPRTMKILSVPEDMKVSHGFLTYEATYKRKGNSLLVRRVLDDRTRGNVCSPKVGEEYHAFAKKVWPNLKAQVVYK